MKNAVLIVMVTLILCSCYNQRSKAEGKSSAEPLQADTVRKEHPTVSIKDSTQYDKAFIKGLEKYNEPIQLIDNYIIVGTYTTYFPEDIPLNKTVEFKATKNQKKYVLSVSRTNLTNLTYGFKLMDEKDKLLDSKSGTAVLGSMFFFGTEGDDDSLTGDGYSSYEYWDNGNDCWFSVRIGHEKDPQGKQRAKIQYGCEDKNKQALKLKECPTLRTE